MAELQTLVQKQLSDMNLAMRGARGWFRGKIAKFNGTTPKSLMKNTEWHRGLPEIGSMYAYFYDPKWKDQLPFYDRFPLTIVIEKYGDGFLGMNLHYLPPMFRLTLLDKLMEYSTDRELNVNTKFKLTYGIVKSAAKMKEAQPCIKKYLYGHVQTKFLLIPPTEWEKTIFLPVESFQKQGKNSAWNNSIGRI